MKSLTRPSIRSIYQMESSEFTDDKSLDSFRPHPLFRHHFLQTVLSVQKPKSSERILDYEYPFLVDGGEDKTGYDQENLVRLLAYYSTSRVYNGSGLRSEHSIHNGGSEPAPPERVDRGLVLMLHGWQGCSHSTYNLVVTDALLRAGYDVVRLNFRDHGPNIHMPAHQLNKGFFFGTLIDEAMTAACRIGEMAQGRPFSIVGPSMGGNFALRLAMRHSEQPIPNLRRVIAISPAINPASATDALDKKPFYRHYFRSKWLRSIDAKVQAFPGQFTDLRQLWQIETVRDMTEWVIPRLTEYGSADEYFGRYTVKPAHIPKIEIETTIIAAKDDPVIPVSDFYELPDHPHVKLHIMDYGGHVGFVDFFPFRHCLPKMILDLLD